MTKAEYLKQLDKRLKRLPAADYEEAMEYFEEYFAEIDEENEAAAIEELGTPKQAAAEVISRMLDEEKNADGKKRSAGRVAALTILGICAAPIGLPLIIAVLAVVLALAAVGLSILISGFAVGISFVCAAVVMAVRGFIAMAVSVTGGLMIIGSALVFAGIGIATFVLVIWCCRWIVRGIKAFAKKVTERR